jgi:hypothetical protein
MISKTPRIVGNIVNTARHAKTIVGTTTAVAINPQKILTIPLIRVKTAMVFTRLGLSPYGEYVLSFIIYSFIVCY